jgi:hypothetical protein
MKKILAIALAALMVFAMIACGSQTNTGTQTQATAAPAANNDQPTGGEEPAAEAKSYQLVGKYDERDGQGASMMTAAFLLNLNADGTAVLDRYQYLQYDASDFASNPSYGVSFMSGTWKAVQKDGLDALQIKLAVVNDDGTTSNDQTVYAYEVAGEYSVDINFPIVPGMSYSRTVTVVGGETKQFADGNALIAAYKEEPQMPEALVLFEDAELGASLYLVADGTAILYSGYDVIAEGTWTADSVVLGGEEIAIEKNADGSAAVKLSRDRGDGTMLDFNLTCADASALAGAEPAEPAAPAADAPYTGATIDLGGGNAFDPALVLNEDGTAVLTVAMGINVKYERLGNLVVLFEDEAAPLEGYGATIFGIVPHAWIVDDEAKTMVGQKVGFIYNGEGAQMTFASEDGETMTVGLPAYSMEGAGYTFAISEDGTTLTLTAPEAGWEGAWGQVWESMGAPTTWTIDGIYVTPAA